MAAEDLCGCGRDKRHMGRCHYRRARKITTGVQLQVKVIKSALDAAHTESEWGEMIVGARSRLLGYALSRVHHRADAEDLVSVTILKAISARAQYIKGSNFNAWIFRILTNEMISRWRKRHELLPLGDFVDLLESNYNTEMILMSDEALLAMVRLPAKLRDVAISVFYEELDYAAVSARYNIPIGSVKAKVFYAREELRRVLGGKL